jgi:hypothetical protein
MGVFWISYRIDGDGKGDARQFTFNKAIHRYHRRYWDRTPNFILFESGHTLDFLAHALEAQIDPARDLFVLGEIGSRAVKLCGANTDDDIFAMLPSCRDGAR